MRRIIRFFWKQPERYAGQAERQMTGILAGIRKNVFYPCMIIWRFCSGLAISCVHYILAWRSDSAVFWDYWANRDDRSQLISKLGDQPIWLGYEKRTRRQNNYFPPLKM